MSIKSRVSLLERRLGGGTVVTLPTFLDANGVAETDKRQLADGEVQSIHFSGMDQVQREAGEDFDVFVERAHELAREVLQPTVILPRYIRFI